MYIYIYTLYNSIIGLYSSKSTIKMGRNMGSALTGKSCMSMDITMYQTWKLRKGNHEAVSKKKTQRF